MTRTRASAAWISFAASAVLALGAAPAAAELSLEPVGSFQKPVFVTAPASEPSRIFVVQLAGRVMVKAGDAPPSVFLDISPLVSTSGEEGLLSIAFAPDYASSGRLYAYYVNHDSDIQVDEFTAASPDSVDPASRRRVLVVRHELSIGDQTNHNGGQVQFGPDGLLYLAPGDGGAGNDPDGNAQDLGSLLGKVLRIDPRASGDDPYTVPADNPFTGRAGARPEIYAYGLRNPFRFSFDRQTGDLTIGDVGQSAREEVDFTPGGSGRGANFGWRVFEGTKPHLPGEAPGHVPPVLEYVNDASTCSITGGYVVRDAALGGLFGRYVYADLCEGRIHAAVLGVPAACEVLDTGLEVSQPVGFGEDALGRVYVASYGGQLYRIAGSLDAPPAGPCPPGSGGGEGPGGGPAGSGDTRRPSLGLRFPRRPTTRRISLQATCDERCTLRASATLSVGRRRPLRLRGGRGRTAGPGAPVTLRPRLGPRGLAAARRGLRLGRRVTLHVRVRATDGAGNTRTSSRHPRLRR